MKSILLFRSLAAMTKTALSQQKEVIPEYGTITDFTRLAKALHARGMKLYIDMETQYVTDHHLGHRRRQCHPPSRGLRMVCGRYR